MSTAPCKRSRRPLLLLLLLPPSVAAFRAGSASLCWRATTVATAVARASAARASLPDDLQRADWLQEYAAVSAAGAAVGGAALSGEERMIGVLEWLQVCSF